MVHPCVIQSLDPLMFSSFCNLLSVLCCFLYAHLFVGDFRFTVMEMVVPFREKRVSEITSFLAVSHKEEKCSIKRQTEWPVWIAWQIPCYTGKISFNFCCSERVRKLIKCNWLQVPFRREKMQLFFWLAFASGLGTNHHAMQPNLSGFQMAPVFWLGGLFLSLPHVF